MPPEKKSRAFPTGNALLYILLLSVALIASFTGSAILNDLFAICNSRLLPTNQIVNCEAGCVLFRAHPVFVSSWLGVRQNASPQLLIGFFRHRLAPLVRGALTGHFHCQMREPAIGCSTVPVLDLRGNVHHIARMQLQRSFAPFLIVAPACHADKDLPATLCGMVDVPVVPAARLKGDV